MSETRNANAGRRSTAGTLLYMLIGPVVWSAHLGVIYFGQSMLCAHGLAGRSVAGMGIIPFLILSATLISLALLLAAVVAPAAASRFARASGWFGQDVAFYRRVMVLLAILSAVGVVWAGATTLAIPDCPQLR